MSHVQICCDSIVRWTAAYNKVFSEISNEQFNWKPKADDWSIAECIDHVQLTNSSYIEQLNAIINGQYKRPFASRIPFVPQLFGKMISSFVEPTGKKKTKTFSSVEPTQSKYEKTELLNTFNKTQTTIRELVIQLDETMIGQYYMASPAGGAITYPLKHLLSIIPAHDERHFHQAERLLKEQIG